MRNVQRSFGLALLVFVMSAADASPQEWTRFRGAEGTAISASKNVPLTWTESDFRWRVAIPGESHSQPVVWGDRIFLESAREQGKERMLVCLKKEDGKEAWVKKFPMTTHPKHKFNSFASSSPVVDADRVYALFATPEQFLVKAWDHNGKELWSQNLGPFVSQHGLGASPILYDGKLIVPNDQDGESFIIALDAKSGRQVWKSPRRSVTQGAAYGTPYVLEREGKEPELLLTSQAHGISSINPKNGAPNWEAVVFDKRAVSSPVVAGDLVFGTCGSGGGGNYLAAVRLGGKGNVTSSHQAYTIRKSAPYVPTPIAVGGRLFLMSDDGVASWVEAATGRIIWSERVGGNFFSSPVCIDGRIYCPSTKGEMVVLAAGDEYKVLARNPLGEGSHTTVCVDGDRLYIKTFTQLICVGGK